MIENKKIKVLHILWSFGNGGMENIVKNMILSETESTHSYLAIINNDIDIHSIKKIPKDRVYKIKRDRGSRNFLQFIRLFFIIIKLKPQFVHLHFYNLISIIKPLSYLIPFKIVTTIHGMDDFDKSIEKADKVIAVSKTHLNHIIEKCNSHNISTHNLGMIYNGINIPAFPSNRNKLKSPLKIFVTGRLNHFQKKQDFIIDFFSDYLKYDKDAVLSFFGSGSSEKYLRNRCKDLSISDRVIFEGSVENKNLIERIKNYDVMLSASENETFGINIIESLALGIPVISYPAPTLIEITKNNPILLFYKDKKDLISILKNLPKIVDQRKRLKSHQIIESNYAIEKMIISYKNIYMGYE